MTSPLGDTKLSPVPELVTGVGEITSVTFSLPIRLTHEVKEKAWGGRGAYHPWITVTLPQSPFFENRSYANHSHFLIIPPELDFCLAMLSSTPLEILSTLRNKTLHVGLETWITSFREKWSRISG